MTTNAKIKYDWQQPDVGEIVILYELDLTDLGGSVFRFTENTLSGVAVVFQGQTFFPLDLEGTGFEMTGTGQLPRPKLRLNSRELTLRAALNTYDDMLGAQVRRKRTFSKYLDGQPLADTAAEFPVDLYVVERKSGQNKEYIEFELAAYMDYEGKKIPGRVVLRDTCAHTYRYWDTDTSNYLPGTCPFDGPWYYTIDGSTTTSGADDVCGRRLSDCKVRFDNYTTYLERQLPTRAYPGAGRGR